MRLRPRHLRRLLLGGLGACLSVSVVDPPLVASAATPIVLAGNGLGVARFGTTSRVVTSAVSARLGPPTSHAAAVCAGGYSQVGWHDLIVQFRRGRFSAYRYWTNASGSPSPSASPVSPRLQTAEGVTLGSTFARVKRSYRLTQTGTDFWKAPNGIVFALGGATYPSPPSSPVYEIKSDGACPAAL